MLIAQLFLLPLIRYHTHALNSATGCLFSSLSLSRKEVPDSALFYDAINQKQSFLEIFSSTLCC